MKNVLLLSFIFFINTSILFSQGKVNVDSLVKVAENYHKEDTTKINMWLNITKFYLNSSPQKGLETVEKALIIAQKIRQPLFEANAYRQKGNCFYKLGEYVKAIEIQHQAYSIYQSLKQEDKAAFCLLNIGVAYNSLKKSHLAIENFEKAKVVFEKFGMKKYIGMSLSGMGTSYIQLNNYPKAIEMIKAGLTIAQQINDKIEMNQCHNFLGIAYTKIMDYPKSLESYLTSLAINEELGNLRGIIGNYLNIAIVYYYIKDYQKAIEYDDKVLTLAEKYGDKALLAKSYLNKGSRFSALEKYEQAIDNYHKGLTIFETLEDSSYILIGLSNLANDYLNQKNYTQTLLYGKKAMAISIKLEDKEAISNNLRVLGEAYLNATDDILTISGLNPNERFIKVAECLQGSLSAAQEINDPILLRDTWNSLSSLYEKKGDYANAYQAFNHYITLKDSISNDDIKKQITRKEIQYEFDKKETELKFQQQLTAGELEKQKLLTFQQEQVLALNRQTLTLKEQALTLSNKDLLLATKEKDLAHLAYLKEQAEKQEKMQELSLSQEREKGKELDLKLKNSELFSKSIELSAQQKQNVFLIAFASILLLGLATLLYFYSVLRKQKNIISQQNELNEHTISILSHDIKEPLLGVKLLLKKLNKEDPFVAQASQSLENQINAVNSILNNLLKMKKLALSKKDKNVSANVNEILQNVLQELHVAIQAKNLSIQNEIKDNMTLPIAPEKLQIILHNLLSNAIKYSFIYKNIRIYPEGKGICIQDFGVGLSPEQRSKLMREVTASEKGTNQERGNGLGLFLVGAMLQGEAVKVIFDSPDVGGTIVKVLS